LSKSTTELGSCVTSPCGFHVLLHTAASADICPQPLTTQCRTIVARGPHPKCPLVPLHECTQKSTVSPAPPGFSNDQEGPDPAHGSLQRGPDHNTCRKQTSSITQRIAGARGGWRQLPRLRGHLPALTPELELGTHCTRESSSLTEA
jgi:hypothetical protein